MLSNAFIPDKSGSVPTAAAVTVWWWIHLIIHTLSRLSMTMVMFIVDFGTIPGGSGASTAAQWYALFLAATQDFRWFPKSAPSCVVVLAWWWSFCPFASYECCHTPWLCLKWIWEPWHVGLQPQPPLNGMVWCPEVTQDFSSIFKSQPLCVVVKAWW